MTGGRFYMKFKKMAVSIAVSAAAVSALSCTALYASAAETDGNAGIAFQMADTWNYRNAYGSTDLATFPNKTVGIQGAAYGYDTKVACTDAKIYGNGTYTVSIAASGTITQENSTLSAKKNLYILDSELGLTRNGAPWSMAANFEAADSDDIKSQSDIEWVQGGTSTGFNMLLITTDIPCDYASDKETPTVNGTKVTCTNVTAKIGSKTYTLKAATQKSDEDYLCFELISIYDDDFTGLTNVTLPSVGDKISVTFTLSGLGDHTHSYNSGKVTKAATCTAAGKKVYTCKVCGEKKTVTVSKLKHTYKTVKTVKATTKAKGYTLKKCSVCGTTTKTNYTAKLIAMSKTKVSGVKSTYAYTGKKLTPTVTVKYGKTTLKKGTDYTVTYKNNIKTGKATVTIKGKGKYTGTKTASFVIVPKKAAVSSVKSAKTKTVTVTWKKDTQASGYELVYSTSSKFSGAKKVTVSKNSTVTKTLSSLTKGKTYYVKVRSYKTISGKKYYGAYSAVKKVACK
jgi:hypothetical protein